MKSTTSAFANCRTKRVKIQLRLTLTILYGDQTGNNDDEIRAESLKLDLRFTPENTRPQTCQFLQRSVCPLAEEDL